MGESLHRTGTGLHPPNWTIAANRCHPRDHHSGPSGGGPALEDTGLHAVRLT